MSINFIINIGIILISFTVGYLILIIYDYIRYYEELKILKQIKKIRNKKCMGKIKNPYNIKLLEHEQIFLDEFAKYIKCDNLNFFLDKSFKSIFCINKEKIKKLKNLHKLTYFIGDYYCTNDVFSLYNFLDEKYNIYQNNNISKPNINIELLGSDNLEEDEVIDILLEMKLIEFIKKFSIPFSGSHVAKS